MLSCKSIMVGLELKSKIAPYYLRRVKETTIKLKPKLDLVIWLKLGPFRRKMYLDFLKLRDKNNTSTHKFPNTCTAFEALRSLCSHPSIWAGNHSHTAQTTLEKTLHDIYEDANKSCDREHNSVKLVFLSDFLPTIIKEGESILIFWKYLEMLKQVEKFKTEEDIPIILKSIKVGALGLNLIKASRIILLDPSWNPTDDDQAVDRVYRLNQTRSVVIYRLVCCGTIEERIYKKQILKKTLSRMVIGEEKPLRIFRSEDITKAFNVQEKDFNFSATKKIIDTQLSKSCQNKMSPTLKQHIDNLESADYIHGVSSHSSVVSAVDDPKNVSQGSRKSTTPIQTHQRYDVANEGDGDAGARGGGRESYARNVSRGSRKSTPPRQTHQRYDVANEGDGDTGARGGGRESYARNDRNVSRGLEKALLLDKLIIDMMLLMKVMVMLELEVEEGKAMPGNGDTGARGGGRESYARNVSRGSRKSTTPRQTHQRYDVANEDDGDVGSRGGGGKAMPETSLEGLEKALLLYILTRDMMLLMKVMVILELKVEEEKAMPGDGDAGARGGGRESYARNVSRGSRKSTRQTHQRYDVANEGDGDGDGDAGARGGGRKSYARNVSPGSTKRTSFFSMLEERAENRKESRDLVSGMKRIQAHQWCQTLVQNKLMQIDESKMITDKVVEAMRP